MASVFAGQRTGLILFSARLNGSCIRLTRIDESREMSWIEYGVSMLLFSGVSMLLLYLMEGTGMASFQSAEVGLGGGKLAFNTAASFTTNTNWQAYTPETTMSYLTQMAGLAYHNFMSAAVGMALGIAFIRGISRRESKTIGNFWVDTTRAILWVLLPLSISWRWCLSAKASYRT